MTPPLAPRAPRSLLLSAEYFPPQVGGISTMMSEICAAFGPERIACMTAVEGPGTFATAAGDIPVYRMPGVFSPNRARRVLGFINAWLQVSLQFKPEIVQCSTCMDAALVGFWLKKRFKLPLAIYAHGNEILSAATDSWERPRLALRAADVIMANSRYTAGLVTDLGVAPDRVEVVNPGCDVTGLSPGAPSAAFASNYPDLAGKGPLLLTLGNLVLRKGQDVTLRALPELIRRWPDLRYAIVGEGRDRPQLEALARELGVARHVHFLGRAPREHVLDLLRACDLFLMPSRMRAERNDVEGFGIVFLEANACGKAVVGGRSGGVPDAIVDGRTGLLVDPNDPAAVAAAARTLLENPGRAAEMGAFGRARALQDFSWSAVARRIDDITSRLVARQGTKWVAK